MAKDYWRCGRQVSQWNDQFEDTCFFDSSNDALFSRTVSSSIFPRAAIARRDCKTISFLIASLGCTMVLSYRYCAAAALDDGVDR